LLGIGLSLNSDAHPIVKKTGAFTQIGNKTECALLEMAYHLGYNFKEIRKSEEVIATIPFSS
jgi:Ca2+ transporting ATPase